MSGIASETLRRKVEIYMAHRIPDDLWERAEQYARHKLSLYRQRWPEKAADYDDEYLVILTADTVREMAFADSLRGVSA